MIHPKEYALNQYKDALKAYCENQKTCNFCAFRSLEDEMGDGCPFYVQPPHFDTAYPEEKNCYSCEYGKKAVYCSYDDQYCDEADAKGECACWKEKDYYSAVAKNEATTDDDHSCATCEWYTDGRCLKDCEKHEWFDCCLNHKLKIATTNDHFRETTKKIELMEE